MSYHQISTRNHLLASMTPEDFDLLQPYLEPVSLRAHEVLVEPGRTIEHLFFMDGGLASVVIEGHTRNQSEVAMVGREGMTGIPVLLGMDRTPHKSFVQVAGPARRIGVAHLQQAIRRSPALHAHLLRFVNDFLLQVAETAFANARFHLDQRLARWMLMASDRLGEADVPLTHEFLALMLGVRRPGVTETLHVLEGVRAIRSRRGKISILDRQALRTVAGPIYSSTSIASGNGTTATSRPDESITS
jgi:CRP-like cAMP-binding protein